MREKLSYAYQGSETPLIGKTIPDFLDEIVQRYPDNEALVAPFRGVRYTYREFRDICRGAAKSLMALGVKKGDRVAIWATNYPEWVIVQFSTAMVGAVLVTVNTSYRTLEFHDFLKDSQVQTLFLIEKFKTSEYVRMFYEVCPEAKTAQPGEILSREFPFLRKVVLISDKFYRGMFSWKEFMELGKSISNEELLERQNSLNFDEVINIQYTSGTTGDPKGAMLTHHNILNNGFFVGETMKFTDKDRLCIPVPFFHCFGMVLGNLACVTHGATMVLPAEYFDTMATLRTVEEERCTALHGVPTMFNPETTHPDFQNFNLKILRTGIAAGESCSVDLMERVNDLMMGQLTIAYGLTEASPVITQTPADASRELRTSTVGSPLPHTEVKIIDTESKKIVPCGVIGELCVRGYHVMAGYYNNPKATKEAIDEAGWLHTGDLAKMDENGYCNIIGREKLDRYTRGGENIDTYPTEEFLRKHPKIGDIRIAGIPEKGLGKEGLATIQLKEGQPTLTEEIQKLCQGKTVYYRFPRSIERDDSVFIACVSDEKRDEEAPTWIKMEKGQAPTAEEIRDFCRGKIAPNRIPLYLRFVEDFPMTASRKVQKIEIIEKAIKDLGLKELAEIKVA